MTLSSGGGGSAPPHRPRRAGQSGRACVAAVPTECGQKGDGGGEVITVAAITGTAGPAPQHRAASGRHALTAAAAMATDVPSPGPRRPGPGLRPRRRKSRSPTSPQPGRKEQGQAGGGSRGPNGSPDTLPDPGPAAGQPRELDASPAAAGTRTQALHRAYTTCCSPRRLGAARNGHTCTPQARQCTRRRREVKPPPPPPAAAKPARHVLNRHTHTLSIQSSSVTLTRGR